MAELNQDINVTLSDAIDIQVNITSSEVIEVTVATETTTIEANVVTAENINVEITESDNILVELTDVTAVTVTSIPTTLRLEKYGDYTYIGTAAVGSLESASVWKIMRLGTVDSVLEKLYADGDELFDNVWDDRYTLAYE